ncbi:MAG TPA: ACP S-malonyltransferase [Acidimicrobiales bacterium]|nr:ACP S-malonyltransferase [Acidimicrobiales bacterium]
MPAFVFPGQGSQRPGMGRPWTDHPSWELVADASEVARRDLVHLLVDAGEEELKETRNAQLAAFTLGLVILDAVERTGIEPTACAGHSLGEYTALVAAGSLSFDDGVSVVAERGEAMQAAADDRPGLMVAVDGIDDEAADVACRRADGEVWVANYNAPGQVVLAGDPSSIDAAVEVARSLGARRVKALRVGGAFHTPFMAPARNRLRKALREASLHQPEVPVVANVDGLAHDSAEEWRSLLSAQLCSPVRWRQTVLELAGLAGDDPAEHRADGEQLFAELGPGGVLTGYVRHAIPGVTAVAVATPAGLDRLVETLAGATALHTFAASHHGEHLYVSERIVISPCAGVFEAATIGDRAAREGDAIEVGSLLGRVAGQEVRSAFKGWLMGMLAVPGERVQTGQPVAWLRAG